MLAFVVELLSGRYIATAYNDRQQVEWPPHPARFFSALVAHWAEGEPENPEGLRERKALEWLAEQAAPEILADRKETVAFRTVVPVFVPVNDASQISGVDRSKLDTAETELAQASGEKSRVKAAALVEKLSAKYSQDVTRAIAVPDKFGKDSRAGLQLLPEHRGRQERRFPSCCPPTPRFAFHWPEANPDPETALALESLICRVVRLGHSSSLVQVRVASEAVLSDLKETCGTFRPDSVRGDVVIRWVGAGQVERLIQAFQRHRETESRILPALFVRYLEGSLVDSRLTLARSVFGRDLLIFQRVAGPRLPITSVVGLAKMFRKAFLQAAEQPVHDVLSGHKSDGAPGESNHLAIVPLPYVGSPWADGSLLGLALVLPEDCSSDGRRAVLQAVARLEQQAVGVDESGQKVVAIHLGRDVPDLQLQRNVWDASLKTLQSATWTGPACYWATATPIALDRNPGNLHDKNPQKRQKAFEEAAEGVRTAVERIGLPAPKHVEVVRSCVIPGTAKPRDYPRYPSQKDRPQRVLVHARILFEAPVEGPVLLGAGRFCGLGLCFPVDPRGANESAVF